MKDFHLKYIEAPKVLTEKGNDLLIRCQQINRQIEAFIPYAKKNKRLAELLITIKEQEQDILNMLTYVKYFAEDLAKDKDAIQGAELRNRLSEQQVYSGMLVNYREKYIELVAKIRKDSVLSDYIKL